MTIGMKVASANGDSFPFAHHLRPLSFPRSFEPPPLSLLPPQLRVTPQPRALHSRLAVSAALFPFPPRPPCQPQRVPPRRRPRFPRAESFNVSLPFQSSVSVEPTVERVSTRRRRSGDATASTRSARDGRFRAPRTIDDDARDDSIPHPCLPQIQPRASPPACA